MPLFRRREPVHLRFEEREGLIVPQTPRHVALHADVFFLARSGGKAAVVIEDAYLVWRSREEKGETVLKELRWDRAVVEGRFVYPVEALGIEAGPSRAAEATLTFTDGLIGHGEGPPPAESVLVLRLHLADGQRLERGLWRVRLSDWQQPRAVLEWVG
jgi:hypothetical protein